MRIAESGKRLPAEFYARQVVEVARDLIGCELRFGGMSGEIVETEAYHQDEPACHAYRGPTPRAALLFEDPGIAYVYRSYGVHALLNAVAEPVGVGAAVLIRALRPITGIDAMIENRGTSEMNNLCSGPGKLTQALGIGLDLNRTSLVDGPIEFIGRSAPPDYEILESPRIGISQAVELPWRFYADGISHVSRGPYFKPS